LRADTLPAGSTPERFEPAPCQLLLDLPHAIGEALVDFLPADSNREALEAVLRWPSWPSAACVLIGLPGSGKSHLAKIWSQRAGAVFLRGYDLWEPAEPLRRLGDAANCVIDAAEELAQEALLFHLYNRVVERGGSLLLTANRPVAGWNLRLLDLRSRLMTAWPVRIGQPDDRLLAALLVKQLADRQLRVDADVVGFLVDRMERSFATARALVHALDRASLRARRPVTMALARQVLDYTERQHETDRGDG
jgi:chromosomal replication initiation ATPase DnaA